MNTRTDVLRQIGPLTQAETKPTKAERVMVELLLDIRDELRRLNETIERQRQG